MTLRAARIPTETWVLPRPRPDAYVGGFPLHFERRLWELSASPTKVLHPFGGLAEIGDFVDLNPTTIPTWVGDAHDLHWIDDDSYDLVILDPPYSAEESGGAIRDAAAALGRLHPRGRPRLQGRRTRRRLPRQAAGATRGDEARPPDRRPDQDVAQAAGLLRVREAGGASQSARRGAGVNFEFHTFCRGCSVGLEEFWTVSVRLLTYEEGFGSVNIQPPSFEEAEQC